MIGLDIPMLGMLDFPYPCLHLLVLDTFEGLVDLQQTFEVGEPLELARFIASKERNYH